MIVNRVNTIDGEANPLADLIIPGVQLRTINSVDVSATGVDEVLRKLSELAAQRETVQRVLTFYHDPRENEFFSMRYTASETHVSNGPLPEPWDGTW